MKSYSVSGARSAKEAATRIIGVIFHYAEKFGVDAAECQEMYRTIANAMEDETSCNYGTTMGDMVDCVSLAVEQADRLIIEEFLKHPGKDENGQKLPGLGDEIPEEELEVFRDEFISGDEFDEFIGDHFTNVAKESARRAMRLRAEMTPEQLEEVDHPGRRELIQRFEERSESERQAQPEALETVSA